MGCYEPPLGPYLSKLPAELLLDISLTLCTSAQKDYTTLILVSRKPREVCRLKCLAVVPVVLKTPEKVTQFANYLAANEDAAALIRRLWILQDHHDIISKCINLVALACDGHDFVQITSRDMFQHTQLVDLTIMGLWNFWAQFLGTEHAQLLCTQLENLWLLDHLSLHGVDLKWLSSLKKLTYSPIELRGGRKQFKKGCWKRFQGRANCSCSCCLPQTRSFPSLRILAMLGWKLFPGGSRMKRWGG